jgi:hypothetical protein
VEAASLETPDGETQAQSSARIPTAEQQAEFQVAHKQVEFAERVLSLPTGTAVRAEEISAICKLIQFSIAHGEEIIERLSLRV